MVAGCDSALWVEGVCVLVVAVSVWRLHGVLLRLHCVLHKTKCGLSVALQLNWCCGCHT